MRSGRIDEKALCLCAFHPRRHSRLQSRKSEAALLSATFAPELLSECYLCKVNMPDRFVPSSNRQRNMSDGPLTGYTGFTIGTLSATQTTLTRETLESSCSLEVNPQACGPLGTSRRLSVSN